MARSALAARRPEEEGRTRWVVRCSRRSGSGNGLRLRAVIVRNSGAQDLVKRACLLRQHSIHGQFQGTSTSTRPNSQPMPNDWTSSVEVLANGTGSGSGEGDNG